MRVMSRLLRPNDIKLSGERSEGSCFGLVDTRVDRSLSFEHGWRKVTERGVEPVLIVEADVVKESGPEVGFGLERNSEEPFCFQRVKERLHVGIVVHMVRSIHALEETQPRERLTEVEGGVLDSAVAVESDTGGRMPPSDSVSEGAARERGVAITAQAPAEDLPRVPVHDDSEVPPVAGHPYVSDVRHPELVRAIGCDAVNRVRMAPIELSLSHPRSAVETGRAALDLRQPHQAGDPAAATGIPSRPSCRVTRGLPYSPLASRNTSRTRSVIAASEVARGLGGRLRQA